MFSNIIIVVLFTLFILLIFYKREMLIQLFSTDVTSPAHGFQVQLEQTADIIIKRLEEQITHLEYLLEESNEKIASLDNKIQEANKILDQENNNVNEYLNQSVNTDATTHIGIGGNGIGTMGINHYKDMGRADKRISIIEMADLGYDITEIAKTTGISKGEIMLLLQLNKK